MVYKGPRPTKREHFGFATSSVNVSCILTEIQRVWLPGVHCSNRERTRIRVSLSAEKVR